MAIHTIRLSRVGGGAAAVVTSGTGSHMPEGGSVSRRDDLEAAYRVLLSTTPGSDEHSGTEDTPARAAKAWWDLTSGYAIDPADLLTTFESESYDELIVVRDIPFFSLCEHHLLPFHGTAHVGYVPNGRIVGLSKIARVVDAYARRLQVQERLTVQVADLLHSELDARGVIVVMEAEHLCMSMRGVQKPGSRTLTSVVRGLLKEDARARSEALDLLGVGK